MADSLWTIPFGKFKGEDVEDVPSAYLLWLRGEDWFKTKYKKEYDIVLKELKYRDKFGKHITEDHDFDYGGRDEY